METNVTSGEELYWCLKEFSEGPPLSLLYDSLRKKQLTEHKINQAIARALEQGMVRLVFVNNDIQLRLFSEQGLPETQSGVSTKIAWFVRSKLPVCNLTEVFAHFHGQMCLEADVVSASLTELMKERILLVSPNLRQARINAMLLSDWQFTVVASDKEARVRFMHVRAWSREIAERKVLEKFSAMKILAICEGVVSPWLSEHEGGSRMETEVL